MPEWRCYMDISIEKDYRAITHKKAYDRCLRNKLESFFKNIFFNEMHNNFLYFKYEICHTLLFPKN